MNDEATPSPNGSGSDPTPVDLLEAMSLGGIFFSRVGGGTGPGWQGDTYVRPDGGRLRAQVGPVGTFRGQSVDELQFQVLAAAGGGRFEWVGTNSKGKTVKGSITLSGEPRLLPVDDPAAAAQGTPQPAPAPAGFPSGYGFPASYGYGGGGFLGPGGVYIENAPGAPPGWNWSAATQAMWWNSHGATPEPTGPPPRISMGGHGARGGFYHPEEDPAVKAMRDELKELRGALLEKNKTGDPMAGFISMMQLQMNQANADRAAAAQAERDRWQREDARIAREDQSRKELLDRQLTMIANQVASGKTDPSKFLREMLGLQKEVKEAFGIDGASGESKLADKIVDRVEQALEIGQVAVNKWNPDKKDEKKKDEKTSENGNGNGSGDAPSSAVGVHPETDRALTILELVAKAYTSQLSCDHALTVVDGGCHAAKIDLGAVLDMIAPLQAKTLMGLIKRDAAKQPPAAQERANFFLDAFANADGVSWLDRFLGIARAWRTQQKTGAVAPNGGDGSGPRPLDETIDPPIGGSGGPLP